MKILLPTIFLSTLCFSGFANEHFYKEYTLKSGESIAGLIFTIHSKSKQEKLSLIENSLRVNKLSSSEARRLAIGASVMIPVGVYEYHNKADAKTSEVETVANPVDGPVDKVESEKINVTGLHSVHDDSDEYTYSDEQDEVSTKSSALTRMDTSLETNRKNSSSSSPLFFDLSMERTAIRTDEAFNDNDNQKGEVQSMHLGIYAQLTENIIFGGEVSKDTSANKSGFAADEVSSEIGASYYLPVNNSFSMDALAFYENRNYNFEGLSVGGFGQLNQKSLFVGTRGSFIINDYFAFIGGVNIGLISEVKNTAENAINFKNTNLLQTELSFQYTINTLFQTYLSIANEKNTWEKDSKIINYNSDLLKLGLIFRL